MGSTTSTLTALDCQLKETFPKIVYTEEAEISLFLEIILYSLFGVLFEAASNLSMAAYLSPTLTDEEELPSSTFKVDVQFYTTDSLFEIFASLTKFYFIIIGMVFYGRRLSTYNNTNSNCVAINGFSTYDPLEINDLFWLLIFALGFPVYFYRMYWGVINTAIYFPLGQRWPKLKIYNLVSFFNDVDTEEDDYTIHMISFIWQTFFGPKKFSIIMDFVMIVGFMMSQMWGPMLYFAVPFIPNLLLEFGVYTAMP